MAVVDHHAVQASLAAQLELERARWGDEGEAWVVAELSYAAGAPVEVRVRKRRWRLDVDDDGAAVARAGTPKGWLRAAEREVAALGANVNRHGVVFIPAVEGGDLAVLATTVAEASVAVHHALLELA